jgi:enoyl-CoA hydratase/carnithine racemase
MADKFETLEINKSGNRAEILLKRPELLNAVAQQGAEEIDNAAALLEADTAVRLVTIKGTGRAFSTGIDLKDLSLGKIDQSYFKIWDRAVRRFETMEKIVVCLIHGYAIGGGLQLALGADIRVCTRGAKLGVPAIKEGLIPGLGTWRLARYVGMGRAKRMVLSGDMVAAEEAERIGLIDHLIEDADMDAAFYANYLRLQEIATASDDFQEAMTAYRENRPPVWK